MGVERDGWNLLYVVKKNKETNVCRSYIMWNSKIVPKNAQHFQKLEERSFKIRFYTVVYVENLLVNNICYLGMHNMTTFDLLRWQLTG